MSIFRFLCFLFPFDCILIPTDSVSESRAVCGTERLFTYMMDNTMRADLITFDLFDRFLLVFSKAAFKPEYQVGTI